MKLSAVKLAVANNLSCSFLLLCTLLFTVGSPRLFATPFIEADNRWLRSDIQNLADAGVIKTPVTQWPIMWVNVAHDLENADISTLSTSVMDSYARVQTAYERSSTDQVQGHAKLSAANEIAVFREFGDGAREKSEFEGALDWVGSKAAMRIQFQVVENPIDGEDVRANGSYLGLVKGNWVFSAGLIDRWWGPGWKNSMVLSTNARSIPAMSIQRHNSTAFESPWLSWIGQWTFETFMGKLETDRKISNALLWGTRATFKPVQDLEIGLSRTIIWAGKGRPKGLSTFYNIFLGTNENGGNGLTLADDPSNQQAGIDIKWRLSRTKVPVDAYLQYVGDDKLINGLPSKAIVLYGVEAGQFTSKWGDYRLFLEYGNTTPSGFNGSIRTNNTVFEHSIYQSGYRYRGRSLSATFDNDSEVYSVGMIATNHQDQELSVNYSRMNLNRDGTNRPAPGGNPITTTQLKLNSFEARYRYYWKHSYLNVEASVYDKTLHAYNEKMSNRLSVGYRYEF